MRLAGFSYIFAAMAACLLFAFWGADALGIPGANSPVDQNIAFSHGMAFVLGPGFAVVHAPECPPYARALANGTLALFQNGKLRGAHTLFDVPQNFSESYPCPDSCTLSGCQGYCGNICLPLSDKVTLFDSLVEGHQLVLYTLHTAANCQIADKIYKGDAFVCTDFARQRDPDARAFANEGTLVIVNELFFIVCVLSGSDGSSKGDAMQCTVGDFRTANIVGGELFVGFERYVSDLREEGQFPASIKIDHTIDTSHEETACINITSSDAPKGNFNFRRMAYYKNFPPKSYAAYNQTGCGGKELEKYKLPEAEYKSIVSRLPEDLKRKVQEALEEDSGLSTGGIIGIVVGAVVGIAGIIATIVKGRKHKKRPVAEAPEASPANPAVALTAAEALELAHMQGGDSTTN